MTTILILLALAAVWWVGNSIMGAISDRASSTLRRRTEPYWAARRSRVQARATAAGRQSGDPADPRWRLQAGLIDLSGAMAASVVITYFSGEKTITTYSYAGVDTSTQHSFSLGLFLLFTLAAYAGIGVQAAWRDPGGQTFGQRLFDYAPRHPDGRRLDAGELMKRHMLRLVAAPGAVASASGGAPLAPEHDRWTSTVTVAPATASRSGSSTARQQPPASTLPPPPSGPPADEPGDLSAARRREAWLRDNAR